MVSEKLGSIERFMLRSAWFWAAILLFGILGFLSTFPEFVKTYYRELLFYWQRVIADPFLNVLPFSAFWIFLLSLLANTYDGIQSGKTSRISWYLNGAGKIIVWFYLLWGFNYRAPGIKDELGLHSTQKVPEIEFYRELIHDFEAQLSPNFFADYRRGNSENTAQVRKVVADFLKSNQLKAPGKPKIRMVNLPILRWIGISGIYFPYTYEAYVDGSLPPAQKTFTLGHELVHAYGFTSEAEANFAACASFIASENTSLAQIAYFELILESLRRIRRIDAQEFESAFLELKEDVQEEIEYRRTDRAKYQNWFWEISEMSNDRYLKLQGEQDGIDSYSGFLELYLAWRSSVTP